MFKLQIKILLATIMPFILEIIEALSDIEINCGQLVLRGYESCKIKHNNEIITCIGPVEKVLSGSVFGLIEYECDHLAGHVMSNIDCYKRRDFDCSEKDYAVNSCCPTDVSDFWLGSILGIIFTILFCGLLYNMVYATIELTYFKRAKHSIKVFKNGSKITIGMNDKFFLNGKSKRNEAEGGEHDFLAVKEKENKIKKINQKSKAALKRAIVSTIAGLLLFRAAEACNIIVGVESDNSTMICKGSECKTQASPFTVQQGDKICIEDHFGGVVYVQISEITWRLRYTLVYFTSDYEFSIITKADSSCRKVLALSCYSNTNCSDQLKAKIPTLQGNQVDVRTMCALSTSYTNCICCSYLIKKERKGKLYGVFRKIGEQGMVKFSIQGDHHSKEVTLSNRDPYFQLHLKKFGFKNADLIRIAVLSTSKYMSSPNSLLRYEDKLYYVNGANDKSPQSGLFGDCQVSLDKLSVDFIEPTLDGSPTDGCNSVQIKSPESMISKFVNQEGDFKQPNDYIMRKTDNSTVDTFETFEKGSVTMQIGSDDKNVDQMEGNCNVVLLGSYGCSSCNESAYLVFGVRRIEKEGLVPFYSNCSFDRHSINCDYEPTKLILKNNYSTCFIRMPTLKKQFLVDVSYFNYGNHIKLKKQTNCTKVYYSSGEAFTDLVISKTFFGSFLGTIFISLIFGVFLKMIIFSVYKTKLQKPVETDLVEL